MKLVYPPAVLVQASLLELNPLTNLLDCPHMPDFEPVIGLEVHLALSTKSKMFCSLLRPNLWRRAQYPHLSGLSGAARQLADAQP